MSKYAKLFEVKILHDYFLNLGDVPYEALDDVLKENIQKQYLITSHIDFKPNESTEKTMAGHQMLFKKTANGFFVAVKIDPSDSDVKPFIPLSQDLNLHFSINVNDARFFNYTALKTLTSEFYLFRNDSGNSAGDGLFLTLPVEFFDSDEVYEADQMYAETSGARVNLYRAIRETGPSATPVAANWERIPHDTHDPAVSYSIGVIVLSDNQLYRALVDDPGTDLTNASQWDQFSVLANQYVTPADAMLLYNNVINLDVSSQAVSQVTISISRYGESDTVWQQLFTSESGMLDVLQLNLQTLKNGQYQLEILDNTQTIIPNTGFDFYLDAEAIRDSWFGVIEIGVGNGDFALLEGDGTLRSPQYTIRFMNRAARWRYFFPQIQAIGAGAEVTAEDSTNKILVTDLPRPLTRFGSGVLLQADLSETSEISEDVVLPKPETNRIRYQDAQWFSEIHMSNLSL